MQKIGIALMVVLGAVAAMLGGAATMGFGGFGVDSGMMSEITKKYYDTIKHDLGK